MRDHTVPALVPADFFLKFLSEHCSALVHGGPRTEPGVLKPQTWESFCITIMYFPKKQSF